MTRQIADTLHFRNDDYTFFSWGPRTSIHKIIWDALENPSIGLFERSWSSCCYAGYYCKYIYENNQLYLKSIHTMLQPKHCPIINGVQASYKNSLFNSVYENLMFPIEYQGGFFIGKDFNLPPSIACIVGGYPHQREYNTVYYLEFEKGHLSKEPFILREERMIKRISLIKSQ